MVDQLDRQSITRYVERTRTQTEDSLINERAKMYQKMKYWMPYMDMSNKYRMILGFLLFITNATLCFFARGLDVFVGILGSTTMPFITYVIPGALYYTHLIAEEESITSSSIKSGFLWKKLFSACFVTIGLVFIFIFVGISTYDLYD